MVGRKTILGLGVAALLMAGIAAAAHPGHGQITPPNAVFVAQPAAIPIELFRGSRIFFRGAVNGVATPMMLDSGASMTVLDTAFAQKLGLRGGEAVPVEGASGGVPGRIYKGVTLTVGGLTLDNLSVLAIDMALVGRAIGRPVPVVLGRDAFKAGLVTVDFPGRTIAFASRADFKPPAGTTRIALAGDGHLRSVKLSVADLPPIDATLDLGNPGTVLLSKAYWAAQPKIAHLRSAETQVGGVGGMTLGRKATLPAVDFAGVRLTAVPAVLNGDPKALPTSGGNVGIELFKPFVVTFDDSGDAIYLRRGDAAFAFARERAGLRTEHAGDRLKIAYVSPDGPAARAGLKAGDEIVAVDGRRVDATFYDRPEWTRGEAGTMVALDRADGSKVSLTLADYY